MQQTIVADHADDKVILPINEDLLVASLNLQIHLNLLSEWYENRWAKINLYTQRPHSNKEHDQTFL